MTEGPVPPPTSIAGRLAGRRALITGGGSGIGRAIVDRYLAEDCEVGVLEISEERLGQLEAAHPGRLVLVRGDATRLGDNQRAVDAVVERFGGLDCFVANTGVWTSG
jgi:2,3-dihydroxy-2,3-dihydrophenylpropionate dehydrogenase